jgi:LPS export ABC transporter protein LptC
MHKLSGKDVEILYSDSAKLKVRILAPELNRYQKSDNKPYLEFPKGIHVYFYNDSLKVNAEVYAKYAIYRENEKLWEARNDVVVVNTKGEKLNTEQLFWDEPKEKIYSHQYSRITRPNGEQHTGNKGFEANQDLSNWRMKGGRGNIVFRDEPE